MPNQPDLVSATTISSAWMRALEVTLNRTRRELTPMIVTIEAPDATEVADDLRIRQVVDADLAIHSCCSVSISAAMIFPYKSWMRAKQPNRHEFFAWYCNEYLPRLKARDARNQYGTYFERMIAFSGVRSVQGKIVPFVRNQLDQIITDWTKDRSRTKRPRQSALQAACFDPPKDHTGQSVRGFPCLQQVSFPYDDDGRLGVSAYYPTQYIFDRAYGNYLGLCHLGIFMAHELGLRFAGVTCYIGQPLLGNISKNGARTLLARIASG